MSTQAERLVRIESKSGVQKTVTEADYKHRKMGALGDSTYEDAGWTVVSYEDGTAYEDGAEPTSFGLSATAKVPAIGVDGTNPTTIDGATASESDVLAAGATLAEKPAESTPRRSQARPESAPAPEGAPAES